MSMRCSILRIRCSADAIANAAPVTQGWGFSMELSFASLWLSHLFEPHLHHVHALFHLLHAIHHRLPGRATTHHLTHHRAVHHSTAHHSTTHHSTAHHPHATPGAGTHAAHHPAGRHHARTQRLHMLLHELLALGRVPGLGDLVHLRAQLVRVLLHLLHDLRRILRRRLRGRRGGRLLVRVMLFDRRHGGCGQQRRGNGNDGDETFHD